MSHGGAWQAKVAVGTVVAKNYLPFARVLARSLAEHHPEVPLFVLLADEIEGAFDPVAEPFELIGLAEVGIPDLSSFLFRSTRQQAISAAKPYLLRWLLDRGFERAAFLDADILVLGDLGPLLAPAVPLSILLTPHLLAPLAGPDRASRELTILRAGVYNGGYVGVSDTPAARRFLAWWQERLLFHCRHAVAEGMHYDQRWLDLVPTQFDEVGIVRDPGANVAYWNLPERELRIEGGRVQMECGPCRFFHFSGFEPDDPTRVTRYSPHPHIADVGVAAELFERYASSILAAGWHETRAWSYAFGRFDDGTPIPEIARRLYGALGEEAAAFGDPFRTAGERTFRQWLNQPVDGVEKPGRRVTRLWQGVHAARPDVQRAFPDPLGRDRRAFLNWAARHGAAEHGIPDQLVPGR